MKLEFLTATRSDYSLMRGVLLELRNRLELKLAVTGMHLMEEFGKTESQIKQDGFKYEILNAIIKEDSRDEQLTYFSKIISKLTEYLKKEKPDFVMVVGDRIEALAAAICCTYLKLPLCHLHGGERTSTVDEHVRHAVSKLAHIHFPATEKSKERLLRLGEEEWRITVVGSPGAYYANSNEFLSKKDVFRRLKLGDDQNLFLVVLHPDEDTHMSEHAKSVFDALSRLEGKVVAVYPNTDPGHAKIIKEINSHGFAVFSNLDHDMFLSLMKNCDVMIGNSSAGIIEAPTFGTPVVNIGDRQKDRERGGNVIDCDFDEKKILQAIAIARKQKRIPNNPYLKGDPSKKIFEYLKNANGDRLLQKKMTY